MKLEQVLDLWDKEGRLDRTNLDEESLAIPSLHARWLRILVEEKLRLKALESERSRLKLEKYEFLTQGPTKETQAKGWVHPARGVILKAEVGSYMDADPQMVEMNLRVAYQAEVVSACELIFKSIQGRNWEISRAIEWRKHQAGG